MTDLSTLLKDGDPVRTEEGLSTSDAQRMRRAVLDAAPEAVARPILWRNPWALATAAALVTAVSGVAGHHMRRTVPVAIAETASVPADPSSDVEKRQLQFAAPGGTRIIWIFDENLRLQESMP